MFVWRIVIWGTRNGHCPVLDNVIYASCPMCHWNSYYPTGVSPWRVAHGDRRPIGLLVLLVNRNTEEPSEAVRALTGDHLSLQHFCHSLLTALCDRALVVEQRRKQVPGAHTGTNAGDSSPLPTKPTATLYPIHNSP